MTEVSSDQIVTISLDAMGGDVGPEAVVPGAALALKENPHYRFIIFGDEARVAPLVDKEPALKAVCEIVHTDKFILNDDKPSAALRASKGSSLRLAIEAVKEGRAQAVVSAGNTGALMAISKTVLRTVPGIYRPALASVFPNIVDHTVMLDLGANVLVDADTLVQFAVMGGIFAKANKGIEEPTIGLLNVGTEDTKGPDHVREAASLLADVKLPGKFIGFVEGTDMTKGTVDVIVCDGYAGNIALKAGEGVGALSRHYFKTFLQSDPLALVGSLLSFFALKKLKNRIDPRRYNGGVFLGLNGVCVKSHGGCDAIAFSSAVKLAGGLAVQGYVEQVAGEITQLMDSEEALLS